ncbi:MULTISPECIES: xylulokinase [Micromonospora]|uniref:Xylulose kinase n=1 Tax=Micromonospora solifontis TaxID=2487138 RepID=A0ABX9WJ41_9ACTN|nr:MULTISPECIES: xylulokinase [Micromonospora]NES15561.1 xylulokinase [Micromonospora sp. PPF5-17B]NES35934.1 xylulokinase [Micromonospora solifontis]NES56904.1 xylulokinase [Micromonospora sp. PPF5-6]RNM00219.1 xylulokinase [Micromonospora solifontis]
MPLVAGVDSSTQSCKVVVRDAETGALVRQGRAPHPDGTEVDPHAWWEALQAAVAAAGGLADVAAVSVAGQQHGMVCLDPAGEVVRPALLWNDTRSADAARDLIAEAGGGETGRRFWADATGAVPVASFTATKLRWLARHEPANAERVAAVCLPHDWLTWRLAGASGLDALRTDRGDASGTGYWSPRTGEYRLDLLEQALGRRVRVPVVLGPAEPAGQLDPAVLGGGPGTAGPVLLGPGTGDNAAAALGVGAGPGDVVVSIGTSGTVFAVADAPAADPAGAVAGFADATGRFLPLVCTLNAARVLDAAATLLGVDLDALSELALAAPPGADGLVMVPYLEGERTPDRPTATGALHGLTLGTSTPAHLARAAVEGMLCALADGLDALVAQGARADRIILVGGGARSVAVRRIAPQVFGRPVVVPPPGEYVADGAARQAAWVALGGATPPSWVLAGTEEYAGEPVPAIRERYARARDLVVDRPPGRG